MKGLEEVEGWAAFRAGTGLSARYVKEGRRLLLQALEWMQLHGVESVHAVTRADLRAWLDDLLAYRKPSGDPLAPFSIMIRILTLRAFYAYLHEGGRIVADPTRTLPVIPERDTLPRKILERAEVDRLLAEPDLTKPIEYRDRTILEVLYSTGLRTGEVAALSVEDVDFPRGLVTVQLGKNRHGRLVAIGDVALSFLTGYLRDVRPRLLGEEATTALFLTGKGKGMTSRQVGARVKMYVLRAELRPLHSAHSLRHTCATHMLEGGAGIRYVAEQLGHRDLESTVVYTRVTAQGLARALRRWHPRERQRKEEAVPAPERPRAKWGQHTKRRGRAKKKLDGQSRQA